MSADAVHAAGVHIAIEHLELRLTPLRRVLRAAVAAQKRQNAALAQGTARVCVTETQVDQLLDQVSQTTLRHSARGAGKLTDDEQRHEVRLRAEAVELELVLPLDALKDAFALSHADVETLLICAAAELNRGYGRIFAFIQDDLARQLPTIDLLCGLTSGSAMEWIARRRALGPHGALRRLSLLLVDDAALPELGKACRLAPRALQALTDPRCAWHDLFCDPTLIDVDASLTPDCFAAAGELRSLAQALHAGRVNLIGVWGEMTAPVDDAVRAVASAAGRPLRRWIVNSDLAQAQALAIDTDSVLWIDADRLHDETHPELAQALATLLEHNSSPVILSGEHPWRPTELLAARSYAEVSLAPPGAELCARQWQQQIPALDAAAATDLAARYRMSIGEQKAVAKAVQVRTQLGAEAGPPRVGELCRMVAQKKASRFAKTVVPRRGPDDLVLPEYVRNQVIEIPRFYRALNHVNETWGFGRMMSGGGLKALFTGDSGTGKTLAAEVIAHELDLPLLKVDLAQLVSKWVGETEKNLEAAFREAESCHAILFFDEADTLFGKRGEIQHGSDRYANLETGFLLQRLERFAGLAVLASNLRDEIDPAFIRRFHVLLHFPRPQVAERIRLWTKAFPPNAPLHPGIDLAALADIDLTGAGIVAAGHTAALLAADARSDYITREHLAAAIGRQFHREARILPPGELARFRGAAPPPRSIRRHEPAAMAAPLSQ
jgi:hypothetical protein